MITLLSLSFWLNFFYFGLIMIFEFFFPGDLILGKFKTNIFIRFVLGVVLGFVMWAWQGYIFGYLGIRNLSYLYLLTVIILWIKYRYKFFIKQLREQPFNFKRIDLVTLGILAVGIVIQNLPMWGNGLLFVNKGMYFCCGNQLDNFFHFALTQNIVFNFPPLEPGMSGALVKNYHYWFNLALADLVRVFHLPLLPTLFQYSSFFLSVFYGLTLIVLSQFLNLKKVFTRTLLFFSFFGADAIFVLLLIVRRLGYWNDVSSLEDGLSFLINPPRASSMVIAIAGLAALVWWYKKRNWQIGAAAVFILATTIGFKIYTALFLGIGLTVLIIYELFKRDWQKVLILSLFYPLSLIIYLPANSQSGGLFYAPMFFANNFIVQPAFGLIRWEMARQIYFDHKSWLRVWQYEIIFSLVTIFSLFGTKMVAFFQPLKSIRRLPYALIIILASGIIGCLFLGFNTLQKSGGANTFNFLVSAWLFMSIPAALAVDHWYHKSNRTVKIILISALIILTIPRIITDLYQNISSYHKFGYLFVTNNELSLYGYLRNSTDKNSLVLVDINHGNDQESPLVYAFTLRPMFLSGKGILDSHNQDTAKRFKIKFTIFKSNDPVLVADNLLSSKIDYLLLWESNKLAATESAMFTQTVLKNPAGAILKVDKQKAEEYIESQTKL